MMPACLTVHVKLDSLNAGNGRGVDHTVVVAPVLKRHVPYQNVPVFHVLSLNADSGVICHLGDATADNCSLRANPCDLAVRFVYSDTHHSF